MIFIKKLCIILVILFACTGIMGCLNPIGIESYGYVVTVGVDVGQEKKYEVVLELQREHSNQGSQNEGGAIILSSQGDTLFEVINELSWRTVYQLNFTRTHVFVFSEELAREGMIQDFFKMSFDTLRIRQSAIIMVTHCSVKEYFGGLGANNNANISKVQEELLSDEQMLGQIAVMDVSRFLEACEGKRFDAVMPVGYYDEGIVTDTKQKDTATKGENPIADVLPGAKTGGMQSQTVGAALFDGWSMVGILDGYETQFLNIGNGDFKSGNIIFKLDGETPVALIVEMEKYDVRIDMSNDKQATVNIVLDISVAQDATHTIGPEWESMSKQKLEDYFKSELDRIYGICKQSNCDAMGFGRYVSMEFTDTDSWENFDWKAHFADFEVEFNVELVLDDLYIALTRQ